MENHAEAAESRSMPRVQKAWPRKKAASKGKAAPNRYGATRLERSDVIEFPWRKHDKVRVAVEKSES